MLKRLSINNLAIIENATVEFDDGFTVLTGATGAGKSLLIDSLSLLLGARASGELIRQGEDKATIVGVFSVTTSRLKNELEALEIPLLGDELTIERHLSRSKNTIKANGVSLSLTALNRITRFLADIHNQFDFARIIDPENYLSIIDGFAFDLILPYKQAYEKAYGLLKDGQYEQAEQSFLSFMEKYPDSELLGNANYWLAESYYARQKWAEAAGLFADGFTKYKSNIKAADSMFKLGLTMKQMDKKKEACTAFKGLSKEFKNLSDHLKKRADQEIKELKCP